MSKLLADLALFAVVVIWGYTFVAIKNALTGITPFNFITARFIIAFAILVLLFRRRLHLLDRRVLIHGIIIGVFLFLAYALQTAGLIYTSASNAGFITGFSVVLVPLLSAILFRYRPSAPVVTGIIFAVAGLAMMMYTPGSKLNIGDLMVLLCTVAIAFHILAVGYYTQTGDSVLLTVVQIGVVAALSSICAVIFEKPVIPSGRAVWSAIIVCSLFATLFAYLVQNIMQRFTSPVHTALIFSGEPVFAGLFGYILLGERLGLLSIAGCLMILSGMVVSEFSGHSRSKNPDSNKKSDIINPY